MKFPLSGHVFAGFSYHAGRAGGLSGDILESVANLSGRCFKNRRCAELDAISRAIRAKVGLNGAEISILDVATGLPVIPCKKVRGSPGPGCAGVLNHFGINNAK